MNATERRNYVRAVRAKSLIYEGVEEIRGWASDGMLQPRTAQLLEMQANKFLMQLSELSDAYELGDVIRNIIEHYELDTPVPPTVEIDPVQLTLYRHRKEIL